MNGGKLKEIVLRHRRPMNGGKLKEIVLRHRKSGYNKRVQPLARFLQMFSFVNM